MKNEYVCFYKSGFWMLKFSNTNYMSDKSVAGKTGEGWAMCLRLLHHCSIFLHAKKLPGTGRKKLLQVAIQNHNKSYTTKYNWPQQITRINITDHNLNRKKSQSITTPSQEKSTLTLLPHSVPIFPPSSDLCAAAQVDAWPLPREVRHSVGGALGHRQHTPVRWKIW